MIREDRFNIILFLGIVSMNLRYPKTLKPVSALDGPDRRAQLKRPERTCLAYQYYITRVI